MKGFKTVVGIFACLAMLVAGLRFSFVSEAASEKVFVVSGSGDYSGISNPDGTYKTIQSAINAASGATKIYVKDGTYKELVNISKSDITLQGYTKGAKTAIVSGEKAEYSGDTVALITVDKGVSNVKIDNLLVTSLSTDGEHLPIGIYVKEGTSNITINDVEVTGIKVSYDKVTKGNAEKTNAHGILVAGSESSSGKSITNVTITNCDVHNNQLGNSEALVLNGNVDGFDVSYNTVHDNDNIGIDIIGFEKFGTVGKDQARNGVVSHNYVYNISSRDNRTYYVEENRINECADGIYVDGGCYVEIHDNFVMNCDIGIETASEHKNKATNNIKVYNNAIYNCNGYTGLSIGGSNSKNGSATNIEVCNNTIFTSGSGQNFVLQYASSDTNLIHHNVFARTDGGANFENGGPSSQQIKIYDNIFTSGKNLDKYSDNIFTSVSLKSVDPANFILTTSATAGYGYAKNGETPTVTPKPTSTPKPTATPKPTVTPKPTATPKPTVTPKPTSTPKPTDTPSSVNIKIDGKTTDWSGISSTASSGNIKSVKTVKDSGNAYFCIEVSKFESNYQLFLNVDGDKSTGYSSEGYDYMIENGTLYKAEGNDWNWTAVSSALTVKKASKVLELSIDQSKTGSFSDNYGYSFVMLNSSYSAKYTATKN